MNDCFAGASVHYNRPVQSLHLVDNVFVATSLNCAPESFDCVVLTTPVPEIFNITGDVNAILGKRIRFYLLFEICFEKFPFPYELSRLFLNWS